MKLAGLEIVGGFGLRRPQVAKKQPIKYKKNLIREVRLLYVVMT
jgi:hypothetical protein